MDVVSLGLAKADAARKYAKLNRANLGLRWAFLGDSTIKGGQVGVAPDPANNYLGDSWPTYLHLMSGGLVGHVLNAGVAGETSAQILARVPDVIASGADTCAVLCGTNDNATNVLPGGTAAQLAAITRTNLTAIADQLLAAGIVPVLCTVVPTNSSANADKQRINFINYQVRAIARSRGLVVLDHYGTLVDPAGAAFKTGLQWDAFHPNYLGYRNLGQNAWNTLKPLLPAGQPWLAQENLDTGTSILVNPLFLNDANSDGVPDNYSALGDTSHYTIALTTDADFPGKALTITSLAGATGAAGILAQPTSTNKFAVGDKLRFSGALKLTGSDVYPTVGSYLEVRSTFVGSASAPADIRRIRISCDVPISAFTADAIVPTGCTAIQVILQLKGMSAGIVAKFGQVSILNLTSGLLV